jgi:hypothetical protein
MERGEPLTSLFGDPLIGGRSIQRVAIHRDASHGNVSGTQSKQVAEPAEVFEFAVCHSCRWVRATPACACTGAVCPLGRGW